MMPESRPHYAHTTRLLLALHAAGDLPNVVQIAIEPQYGHVGRIVYRDGSIRLYRGGRTGINPHGSSLIAKDKGYSKYFLRQLGYQTSDWQTFITQDYAQRINTHLQMRGKTADETPDYVRVYIHEDIGYPCYMKPNEGSQGRGVYRCESDADAGVAIADFSRQQVDVFIVEAAVDLPDYRVVVFDGACIAAYARRPLVLVGDGQQTIAGLLRQQQTVGNAQGRKMLLNADDVRLRKRLQQAGYGIDDVLPQDMTVQVHDVANLSLGGMMHDVSDQIHPHWQQLCIAITQQMGLRLCGIDLACAAIADADAAYSIIEINASPGMENYAALGEVQASIVRQLYQRIFNEIPAKPSEK